MTAANATWRTQAVACALCGSEEHEQLFEKGGFRYVRCRACGHVFVNPRLLPEEVERIYAVGHASKTAQKPRPADFISFKPILDPAERYRKVNRLLDVGCFNGYLLAGARERGWEVAGTEISESAARFAREEMGIDVFLGELEAAHYPEGHFDYAVMSDVIEHLPDPVGTVTEIARILRPGGALYVDTPNFASLTRAALGASWSVFFPWHLQYFTPRTLRMVFDRAGLEVDELVSWGLAPLSRYDPLQDLATRGGIAKSPSSFKRFARRRLRFVKAPYMAARAAGNAPLRLASRAGVHGGSKLVAIAVRPR